MKERKRKVTNKSRTWERQFVGHPLKAELVDVTLMILSTTEKAIQVSEGLHHENGQLKKHWLPKSQLDDAVDWEACAERANTITVTMPRWLFEEKGFTSDD